MNTWKQFLNEKIYGNLATVYHRTKAKENILPILQKGFTPGIGDAYGKGLYTNYELDSTSRSLNEMYGTYVIKFKVNLANRFLIFDYDVAQKVYGDNFSIVDQLKILGVKQSKAPISVKIPKVGAIINFEEEDYQVTQHFSNGGFKASGEFDWLWVEKPYRVDDLSDVGIYQVYSKIDMSGQEAIDDSYYEVKVDDFITVKSNPSQVNLSDFIEMDHELRNTKYTSDYAYNTTKVFKELPEQINGIIFTGRFDGKVCVLYKPQLALMLSWGRIMDPDAELRHVTNSFWNTLDNNNQLTNSSIAAIMPDFIKEDIESYNVFNIEVFTNSAGRAVAPEVATHVEIDWNLFFDRALLALLKSRLPEDYKKIIEFRDNISDTKANPLLVPKDKWGQFFFSNSQSVAEFHDTFVKKLKQAEQMKAENTNIVWHKGIGDLDIISSQGGKFVIPIDDPRKH